MGPYLALLAAQAELRALLGGEEGAQGGGAPGEGAAGAGGGRRGSRKRTATDFLNRRFLL